MAKLTRFLPLSAYFGAAVLACDSTRGIAPSSRVASVTLPFDSISTVPGAVVRLRVELRDSANALVTDERARWSSTDTTVARVDSLGQVTAQKPGTSFIVAASGMHADTVLLRLNLITFTSVSAGDFHACAVATDGAAYCWGSNPFGELGVGDTLSVAAPVRVLTSVTFSQVAAGVHFTCGLSTGGALYCWGSNGEGQLGLGAPDRLMHLVPQLVSSGTTYVSVVGADRDACALSTKGAAFCWGYGRWGQIGNGDTASVAATPTSVTGGLTFTSISVGIADACAVTTDSAGYCWGFPDARLGTPPCATSLCSATPQPVSGGLKFASLWTSGAASCGVTADGTAWCWGDNRYGLLGVSLDTAESAVPVRVSGSVVLHRVYPGLHDTCGLTNSGAAYCWGSDAYGQLGTGGGPSSTQPVAVSGGLVFASLSTAEDYTCGLTTAQLAYCWGLDQHGDGQMGSGSDGMSISFGVPRRVFGQQ